MAIRDRSQANHSGVHSDVSKPRRPRRIEFVNRWPASRIDDLMPWTYAKANDAPEPSKCQRISAYGKTIVAPQWVLVAR